MKPQKWILSSLTRISHWLTLLVLLVLSAIPAPPVIAATPAAQSIQPGQNQHIEPG